MLNNVLGEEDLNPGGFHRWPADRRMSSMMAPTVLRLSGGRLAAAGSGGSNRIRTAILQVISNLVDFRLSTEAAVTHPRIHHERELLSIEGGYDDVQLRKLVADYPRHEMWPGLNLFFGGAHTALVGLETGEMAGTGDPRRGGVSHIV